MGNQHGISEKETKALTEKTHCTLRQCGALRGAHERARSEAPSSSGLSRVFVVLPLRGLRCSSRITATLVRARQSQRSQQSTERAVPTTRCRKWKRIKKFGSAGCRARSCGCGDWLLDSGRRVLLAQCVPLRWLTVGLYFLCSGTRADLDALAADFKKSDTKKTGELHFPEFTTLLKSRISMDEDGYK